MINKETVIAYTRKIYRWLYNCIVHIIPENNPIIRRIAIRGMRSQAKVTHKRLQSLVMGVFAVDHCNLNCKCCSTYSPIAEESFLNIETFQIDVQRLAKLTGGVIDSFFISGGEPLLHPQITDIISIARKHFSSGRIFFITNGLLLTKMPTFFWENMKENCIEVTISKYPIKIDMERITETAELYGVKCGYVDGEATPVKKMWKYPLDIEGKQPLNNNYDLCTQINRCPTVRDGIIYPCTPIARIHHFNKYFGKNLQLAPNDTLELHKANSINDIFEFLSSPKPFCRYCNRAGITLGIPYGPSKKEISEWT